MKKAAGSLDLILNTVSYIILNTASYWLIILSNGRWAPSMTSAPTLACWRGRGWLCSWASWPAPTPWRSCPSCSRRLASPAPWLGAFPRLRHQQTTQEWEYNISALLGLHWLLPQTQHCSKDQHHNLKRAGQRLWDTRHQKWYNNQVNTRVAQILSTNQHFVFTGTFLTLRLVKLLLICEKLQL